MEVSDRKEEEDFNGSFSASSSSDSTKLFCHPCSGDGQHVEAEGYCQNCREYLCVTCITHHRKVTLSKHHVILDKHSMPTKKQQSATTPTCTEMCDKHGTEFVKFFCKQHEAVGCGDCMILGHKSCKVDYIPDIAESFINGSEFSSLVKDIERLVSVAKEKKAKVARDENDVSTAHLEAVKDVRQFRKDADAYLDRMERELLTQCDKLKKANAILIQKTTDDCRTAESKLGGIHAQLTSPGEQASSLFVKTKKTTPLVKEMEQKLQHTDDRSKIQVCKFRRSQAFSDMISKCSPLGHLESPKINIVDSVLTQKEPINVRSASDTHNCWISSVAVINEDTLACTDWNNYKVKLVDVKRAVVSDEIKLPSPWDLTYIPENQLAVTLTFSKQIQFLSFRSGLSKRHAILVGGKCRGITYSKDRLVVSYEEDPKVEIMTLEGKVLQCFKTDNSVNALFSVPYYVAVSYDANFIYVSDRPAHSVIKLSSDGQVLATYNRFSYPMQLVVCKDGSVLVCSCGGNSVHLLSPECEKLKILLENQDGVVTCWALCYSEDTNTLFLSNKNDNLIRTYKIV